RRFRKHGRGINSGCSEPDARSGCGRHDGEAARLVSGRADSEVVPYSPSRKVTVEIRAVARDDEAGSEAVGERRSVSTRIAGEIVDRRIDVSRAILIED